MYIINIFNEQLIVFSCINLGIFIYIIGSFGIALNKKNLILVIISIELMFLGISLLFIFSSLFFNIALGQIYALLILAVSTCESAVFMSSVVITYRLSGNLAVSSLSVLKG
jgi:NADH-quinone oxidoreductase subunit K